VIKNRSTENNMQMNDDDCIEFYRMLSQE